MSLLDFQKALVRLYTDASAREAFLENRDEALRGLSLSRAEKTALAGIDARGLRRYCRGLARKIGPRP